MNFSSLGSNDRTALIAAAVVVITALLSISNNWGLLMVVSLLGGIGVIAVILQPQLAPTMKLPTSKGGALLGLGAITTLATALTALNWLWWIPGHLLTFDAIQFLVGLVAAIVMLYAGWMAYASRGMASSG